MKFYKYMCIIKETKELFYVKSIPLGGVIMATSSILTNVVIRDPKKAEVFADALEASSQDPKRKSSASTIPILGDADAIRRFLTEKGRRQ